MNPESKLLFIAATHGNEGYSIPILEQLACEYPKEKWGYDWIMGNPKALEKKVRFTEVDLNRNAPGDPNSPIYEERRAAEIISLAQNFDMVVDIHGTTADTGLVKIIPYPSVENLVITSLFPNLINVIWNSVNSIDKGPPVQFMRKPAIELECNQNSESVKEALYQSLVQALEIKQAVSWVTMLENIACQSWYQVVGTIKEPIPNMVELMPFVTPDGIRYPFLSNQYRDPAAYLLKKISIPDQFLST